MTSGFSQRFEQSARALLPFMTALLFILASSLAWPLPHVGAVAPMLGFIAIFYWSAHRPDLLRPFGVFALGLLQDAIGFFPMGLSSFVYVALYVIILSQRRFFVGQIFVVLWAGFALVAVMAMLVQWIFMSFYSGHLLSFMPIFLQTLLTIVIFPLPVWVLIKIQRNLLSQG